MAVRSLKFIFFISLNFLFFHKACGQFDLSIVKIDSNVYTIKITNSLYVPIGIRCSPTIFRLTENDTLELKIPAWYNGNGRDYYYDLDFTTKDFSMSEGSLYSIFILPGQTSIITNIRLTDYSDYKIHNLYFGLTFTKHLTEEDIKTFSNKEPSRLIGFPPTKEKIFEGGKSVRLN